MATVIYSLCALVALLCAVLLLRAYRATRYRLLFWSALCFGALTVNNVLLFMDKIVLPMVDLSFVRILTALAALGVLLIGLIWDAQ
jgi:hypothetical protein